MSESNLRKQEQRLKQFAEMKKDWDSSTACRQVARTDEEVK